MEIRNELDINHVFVITYPADKAVAYVPFRNISYVYDLTGVSIDRTDINGRHPDSPAVIIYLLGGQTVYVIGHDAAVEFLTEYKDCVGLGR